MIYDSDGEEKHSRSTAASPRNGQDPRPYLAKSITSSISRGFETNVRKPHMVVVVIVAAVAAVVLSE